MKITYLVALACLVAAPAVAQDTAAVFAALDTNSDSRISAEEAQRNTFVTSVFTQADTNNDGYLAKAEFDSAFGK